MTLLDYLSLVRLRYHITFLSVLLGAFLFSIKVDSTLIKQLALLYLSFNVLLYGGIYTLNDIADAKSDLNHPTKSKRPIASKKISPQSAKIFAFASLGLGLASAFVFFNRQIFYACIAALALNILYTHGAKKIPYAELIVNSATHPLRFLIGMMLVTSQIDYLPVLATFFMALGFACVRRSVEKDVKGWETRKTLKHYTKKSLLAIQLLSFLAIAVISASDSSIPKAVYMAGLVAYLVLVFGTYVSGAIRNLFREIFTK